MVFQSIYGKTTDHEKTRFLAGFCRFLPNFLTR